MPPRKETHSNDDPLTTLIEKFDTFLTNHATTTAETAANLAALQDTIQQQVAVTSKLLTSIEKQPAIPANFSFGSLNLHDSPGPGSKLPPNTPPNNNSPPHHTPRQPKIHLPNFDGSNPLDWLFQASNYFEYYAVPPAQRLSLAQFYFTGEALSWYKYLAKNNMLSDWPAFSRALELRFGHSSYENHQAALFKLCQTTTVTAYVAEFERLSNYVVGLSPNSLLNCFLSGLRQDIQNELSVLKPSTFPQAVGLAKLIEDKLGISSVYPSPSSTIVTSNSPPTTPALLPAPTNAMDTLPTARLTPEQLQQRRNAGLCFRCSEKFTPGHRCNPPRFMLINSLEDKALFEDGSIDTNHVI